MAKVRRGATKRKTKLQAKLLWPAVIVAIIVVGIFIINSIASSSAFTITPPPIGGGNYKLYVATSGSDRNTGKEPSSPLRSIEEAVKRSADIVVLMGTEYQLPTEPEHTDKGYAIPLTKSLTIVSNQTPWEQSPSSSKGGYTAVVPPRIGGKVLNQYHILKLKGKYGVSPDKLTVKFIRFSNTELVSSLVALTRYQGD